MASPNPGLMAALLKSGRITGAVRWKVALSALNTETESAASGFTGYYLDTSGAKSINEFFEVAAKQLELGDLNLANFETKLTGLTRSESGAFIAWSGWQDFVRENPDDAAVVVEVFDSVSVNWPGAVFIVDVNGKIANVSELSLV